MSYIFKSKKTVFVATLLFMLILLSNSCANLNNAHLESPDGSISLTFKLDKNGKAFYNIQKNGRAIIGDSRLGLKIKSAEGFTDNLKISSIDFSASDRTWDQVWGENKTIRDNYNQMIVRLVNAQGSEMEIIFKAYNDGTAFRYFLNKEMDDSQKVLVDELSEFAVVDLKRSWWIEADFDSYEKLYKNTGLDSAKWVATPFTYETEAKSYISIHEANLTNYSEMTLKQVEPGVLKCELVPWANGDLVRFTTSLTSPWRTVIIADKAADLVESNLILNLNDENRIKDVSWIKPMTYIGIWWGMHIGTETWVEGSRHGANTQNAIRHIDFAADNNIGGLVIEGWNSGWDKWGQKDAFDHVTPASDYDLKRVAEYALAKGVYLIGHNETGGDIESYERMMPKAFELYNQLGIKAVKTGYAGGIFPRGEHHHGQMMVEHYDRVVKLAAKYSIMLDVHEPIKATGLRRTWPNMMTREGVRGMEWNAWSEGNSPDHTLIIPFTRALGGPIDYTPGIFDVELLNFKEKRVSWNTDKIDQTRVHSTLAKQLALMVTLYSPLQMAADLIDNYKDNPAFEMVSKLKTTFDRSIVLNAAIGEYFSVARQSGDNWFIASTTGYNSQEFNFKLDFLRPNSQYKALIIQDADGSDWLNKPSEYKIETRIFKKGDSVNLKLGAGGGAILYLEMQ